MCLGTEHVCLGHHELRSDRMRNVWEAGQLAGSHEALKDLVSVWYFISRDWMSLMVIKQRSDVSQIPGCCMGNGWGETGDVAVQMGMNGDLGQGEGQRRGVAMGFKRHFRVECDNGLDMGDGAEDFHWLQEPGGRRCNPQGGPEGKSIKYPEEGRWGEPGELSLQLNLKWVPD